MCNVKTASMCRLAIATVALAGLATSTAQAASPTQDEWQFEVTPYLFGSALSGTTDVSAVSADVDMSFGVKPLPGTTMTLQERAYTSPIWYNAGK